MTEELLKIRKRLSEKLKKERFEHTVGVMYTAGALAMCYGEDMELALTAGLLHDCGKYCSAKDQITLCQNYGIELTASELMMPALVHAKLGAYLARHEYKIKNQAILDSITYHTTGRPGMTMLEKIIYIADYIEPNRRPIPGLDEIRGIVFRNIDRAVYLSAERTVQYLKDGGKSIDPMTISTCEYYKKSIAE
nr:bis(5'-nucleosyl)-tetraphosphatase (symmetrical) YqeK [uncultured Mediterraneibacter sp.]